MQPDFKGRTGLNSGQRNVIARSPGITIDCRSTGLATSEPGAKSYQSETARLIPQACRV
jgi:hypothetical protein